LQALTTASYGLRNPPLMGIALSQVWYENVALVCEMAALAGATRRREPKRVRPRAFAAAGCPAPQRPAPHASASPNDGPGRPHHRGSRAVAGSAVRLTSHNEPAYGRRTAGPVEPRPPGATAGRPALENQPCRAPQASRSLVRKIEARAREKEP
jgi:hypothetical protein